MGWLDRVMGREASGYDAPSQEARTHVIPIERPFVNQYALDKAGLRIGVWVMTADGVGIVTGSRIDGIAEVTLAKPDGSTKMILDESDKAVPMVVLADPMNLRRAYIEEIPEKRHNGSDHLRSFGYIAESEAA